MAIYQVRVVQDGRTVARKQLGSSLGAGEGTTIKAQAGVVYILQNGLAELGGPPVKIAAKRVGRNLHIAIDPQEPSVFDIFRAKKPNPNPDVPDLVIEGYFDFPPAQIMGALEGSGLVAYDLGDVYRSTEASVRPAADTDSVVTGATVVSNLPEQPLVAADKSNLQIAGVAGLGLALAGGGGGGGGSGSASTASSATTAQNIFNGYSTSTDPQNVAPKLTDYTVLGVKSVSVINIDTINSAIAVLPQDKVDTPAKLQEVVDAYLKILTEANGGTADTDLNVDPLAEHYRAIGVTALGTAQMPIPNASLVLSLLNDVIDSKTLADVTVPKIDKLAQVVIKVIDLAAAVPSVTSDLTIDDLLLLGLPNSGAAKVTAENLSAIKNAIANAASKAHVDSSAELNSLAQAAATIVNYANGTTQTAPLQANYTALGIMYGSSLTAMNEAVKANGASGVDTKAKLQAIAAAYIKIITEANSTAADANSLENPTRDHYATIGADIGAAKTNDQAFSLFTDSLRGLESTMVDEIAEINTLAAAANAVVAAAAGGTPPTMTQLDKLPVTGLLLDNLEVVQVAIANTADSGLQVDTLAELQSVATAAIAAQTSALNVLKAYATLNTNTLPTLADYNTALAISKVNIGNLSSINSAVDALASGDVDTALEVRSVVDAYVRILAEANGAAPDANPLENPTADDFTRVGANVGLAKVGLATDTNLEGHALRLLIDSIAGKATTDVDTIAEINALGAAVDKVMNLAKLATGSGVPGGALVIADLTLLGVTTTNANTAAELLAIQNAIISSNDMGSGVTTIMALNAIVAANSTP